MRIIIAHLSDSHFKSNNDPLSSRASNLANVLLSESNGPDCEYVIAFTGDVIDKGKRESYNVASSFFGNLSAEIFRQSGKRPSYLMVPGNHDVSCELDNVRDALINTISASDSALRCKPDIEQSILRGLSDYFVYSESIANNHSISNESPYYKCVDFSFNGYGIRFHLVNSSWMCMRKQFLSTLSFPVSEFNPPALAEDTKFEIALLHHPYHWFKQPEVMRPLRDAIEKNCDLVMTGHEHVSRSTATESHETGITIEYRDDAPLQEWDAGDVSGFHALVIDTLSNAKEMSTYQWTGTSYVLSFARLAISDRASRPKGNIYRIKPSFSQRLDDPELAITHPKAGKVSLSNIYTYPDLKLVSADDGDSLRRLPGQSIPLLIGEHKKLMFLGEDRSGKTSLAKKLFMDIHAKGYYPLLINSELLGRVKPDNIRSVLDSKVREQYEKLQPEEFWQLDIGRRVVILDDLHHAPSERAEREEYIIAIEQIFGSVIIISSEEFYFEEMLVIPTTDRASNALWSYEHYKILPFGYLKREEMVRNWIHLDRTEDPQVLREKVQQISLLLNKFLRACPKSRFLSSGAAGSSGGSLRV